MKRTLKTPKQKKIARIIEQVKEQEQLGFKLDARLKETDYWSKNFTLKELRRINKNKIRAKATGYEVDDIKIDLKGKENAKIKETLISELRQYEKGKRGRKLKVAREKFKQEVFGVGTPLEVPEITDVVLRQVEEILTGFVPAAYWNITLVHNKDSIQQKALNALNDAIAKFGREEIARRLEERPDIPQTLERALYDSKQEEMSQLNLTEFLTAINGNALSASEMQEYDNDYMSDYDEFWYTDE